MPKSRGGCVCRKGAACCAGAAYASLACADLAYVGVACAGVARLGLCESGLASWLKSRRLHDGMKLRVQAVLWKSALKP